MIRALGVDSARWLEMSVGHASITKIRVEADGRYKVISVGDVGHLPTWQQSMRCFGQVERDRRRSVSGGILRRAMHFPSMLRIARRNDRQLGDRAGAVDGAGAAAHPVRAGGARRGLAERERSTSDGATSGYGHWLTTGRRGCIRLAAPRLMCGARIRQTRCA